MVPISRVYRWGGLMNVTLGSPDFTGLCQSSHAGARMLLVHPGTSLNSQLFEGATEPLRLDDPPPPHPTHPDPILTPFLT